MSKVAKINQGLETTFVDLENADDETILASFRDNTKVRFLISQLAKISKLTIPHCSLFG